MSAQEGVFVDVVSVCPATAWVVLCETQRVEVLMCGYHARKSVVVLEARETRLDQVPCDGDGMVFLSVQTAAELRQY